MKFAKELDQELVPEWRIKYLNYKAGKKYVKTVSRAIHRANNTPVLRRSGDLLPPRNAPTFFERNPSITPRRWNRAPPPTDIEETASLRSSPAPIGRLESPKSHATVATTLVRNERQGLAESSQGGGRYGSLVPTPPLHGHLADPDRRNDFELPAPAMRVPSNTSEPGPKPAHMIQSSLGRFAAQRSSSMAASIPRVRPSSPRASPATQRSGLKTPHAGLRRLFSLSHVSPIGRTQSKVDIDLRPLDMVREREREFFQFLDTELEKVEKFYHLKEEQAGQRLAVLREQLHEMRNRRTEEVLQIRQRRERAATQDPDPNEGTGDSHMDRLAAPFKAKLFKPGPNSKALQKMPRTPYLGASTENGRSDYVRRHNNREVPYRTAKRKLKLALQEFYRGLDLLKSYAILNRKAFRKLNKKYDKAVNARPPYRYMREKVNKAWFVSSNILDGHIQTVEDLYARYFERGNHKIAAGKLRNLTKRPGDESMSAFGNGLLIGVGLVLAIQGLVEGAQRLFDEDPTVRQQASFLMQIYGGYFLMLYLFSLFCLDCRIWTLSKINYPFIFEFDPRSNLDWRQLAQFPSFFLFVFGLFIWLNFSSFGSPEMYLYYPVVMICVTIAILFFPAPVLWHRSRAWILYSHWRLLLAGLYPVEFRDFFLGDIYCSLTYAACNVELFFCLYAHEWDDPLQCNSNHSRLLGFMAALPPIWRALQCIRRYHDTKNVFPHLVNCGKYSMTILSAVCLSLYRIDNSHANLSLFITFSVVNAVYCSIWDLFMDFSLLQADSRHYLLRDILGFKNKWLYYVVMVVDPILRFSWIFYPIFTHDTQHSTIVSFLVSFSEVSRRGFWALFRVENEHCANVAQYKASRDVPLPYRFDTFADEPAALASFPGTAEEPDEEGRESPALTARSTALDTAASAERRPTEEAEAGAGPGTLRRRGTDAVGRKIANIMAQAHKQDFEKKRKPDPSEMAAEGPEDEEEDLGDEIAGSSDEVEDDEDETESLLEDQERLRETQGAQAGRAGGSGQGTSTGNRKGGGKGKGS